MTPRHDERPTEFDRRLAKTAAAAGAQGWREHTGQRQTLASDVNAMG